MEKEIKEIEEDIDDMEEDCKKINCIAFLDLIRHTFKCIYDTTTCCFFRK